MSTIPSVERTKDVNEKHVDLEAGGSTIPSANASDVDEKRVDLEAGSTIPSPSASDESLTHEKKNDDEHGVLRGLKLATVIGALLLTILCVALDNTS